MLKYLVPTTLLFGLAAVAWAVVGVTLSASMPLEMSYMRVIPRATAPATCVAGLNGVIYFDTTGNDLCVCQSTTWTPIDGSGTCA